MPVQNQQSQPSVEIMQICRSALKPCVILRLPDLTVMLDCSLDLSSLLHFVPTPLISSERINDLPHFRPSLDDGCLDCGRECSGQVFISGKPEVAPPSVNCLDLSCVDAVLISNYTCMLALPFITSAPDFRGAVYATDPTLQLGKLLMEELVEYMESMQKEEAPAAWKGPEFYPKLPKAFQESVAGHPADWRQIYSSDALADSLELVKLVAFREKVDLFGIATVTAISSGFSIGSANWLIETYYEKFAYMSHCSSLATNSKALDLAGLEKLDGLVLTGLTAHPAVHPDQMLTEFCNAVLQTLKDGGNVLVPCHPMGVVYDIFEILATSLDSQALSSIPMYFLSPVADSSLAFSNIFAEWLSDAKQARVYMPEEPFGHASLVRSGRLKYFKSIHEGLSAEFKTPCVVFAGHPSLRFGDAVHFMELWGGDQKNVVIFPEPDFCTPETIAPFQPLAMRALFLPIDTSMSFSQINKVLSDVMPKKVYIPEQYRSPAAGYLPSVVQQRPDAVQVTYDSCVSLSQNVQVSHPITRTVERVKITPELAVGIGLSDVGGRNMAPLVGVLSAYNNEYSLRPVHLDPPGLIDPSEAIVPDYLKNLYATPYGNLDSAGFLSSLKRAGFDVQKDKEVLRLTNRKMTSPIVVTLKDGETNIAFNTGSSDWRKKVIECLLENVQKV